MRGGDDSGSTDAFSNPTMAQQEQHSNSSGSDENPPTLPQRSAGLPPSSVACQPQNLQKNHAFAETFMNMSLYDPPRWGWTALGGITDVLSPHERSRRHSTCIAYRKNSQRLKRGRKSGINVGIMKPIATTIQPKDPPSYPIASQGETTLTGPESSKQKESSSISARPESLAASKAESPQKHEARERNTEKTTTTEPVLIIPAKTTTSTEGETGVGVANDCTSVDIEDKKQSPPQDDLKVPRDGESIMRIEEIGTSSDQNGILPPPQQRIDIGLEAIGIPTNILGLTIERQQQQPATKGNNDNNEQDDKTETIENNSNISSKKSKKHAKNRRSTCGAVPKIRSRYDCHIRSLGIPSSNAKIIGDDDNVTDKSSDVILDMYAYHYGREGMEARDAETGELLFTQQVTDTNHDFDAPKSTFPIEIAFPLEDEDDDDDYFDYQEKKDSKKDGSEIEMYNMESRNLDALNGTRKGYNTSATEKSTGMSSKKKEIAMYRETLNWDLLDPTTPTPMAFASSIGKEYGLSFGQTMDLAARIDKQIEKHVTATSQYREPIAVRENKQELAEERKIGPILQPYRYDEVIQTEKEGGAFKPKREGRGHPKSRPSTSTAMSRQSKNGSSLASETGSKSSSSGRRRDISKNNSKINDGSSAHDTTGVSLEDELDVKLLAEVKKRSTAESVIDVVENNSGGNPGVLRSEKNAICHICKKRVEVGYHFACSMKNHIYCKFHVTRRLGLTKESGYTYDSCPICSLSCECAKCVRKLKNVATLFKAKCIEQKKKLHNVEFPGILSTCINVIPAKELNYATDLVLDKKREEIRLQKEEKMARQQQQQEEHDGSRPEKSTVKQSRTIQLLGQTMVPRPPLSDFPREIFQGDDFDAQSTDVYFTAYSSEGRRSVPDVPDAWLEDNKESKAGLGLLELPKSKSNSEVQEDGNVDYCHICKTAGHLILCDFCPRGFHVDCMRNDNQCSPGGDQWECFVCKKEKTESDDDLMDGKESIDIICGAFLDLDPTDERAFVGLEVLSIIHQMLTHLVDYDFGHVFSRPVDTSLFPGYNDIVKCPMDIGTICSKLTNGDFARLLNDNFSMDDLVAKVLNDIELIWCNCIMFNEIGSAVARMAVVLRRRAKMIYRRSILDRLSDKVKENVSNFARTFDEAWASGIPITLPKRRDNQSSSDSWKLSAIANSKPKSNLKFVVKTTHGRPIAILDPVRGRVVKLYSSTKSAAKAVEIILKSGHRCEWNASASRTDLNLKLIAEKSRNDPNSLLFGYRWLFLDDLNDGKVIFLKNVCDIVEMQYNHCTFVFRSIEEALSSSKLSKSLDIDNLRKKLTGLPRNGNWTEIVGVKWRRPTLPDVRRDSVKGNDSPTSTVEIFDFGSDGDSFPPWKNCSFLKKDLVTDRNLVGFDSIQLTHQDWIQTVLSSPSFPDSEARSMDNFMKFYLDGDRNVDGMVWQSVDVSNREEQNQEKETRKNGNLIDPMESGDAIGSQNDMSKPNNQGERNMLPEGQESESQESESKPSVDDSITTTNTVVNEQQQQQQQQQQKQQVVPENLSKKMTLDEAPGISRKRKFLDENEIDFSSGKEARLSVVTVE